jgi:hypothetical protein
MTVFCLFDNFGTDSPELVGVVDSRIAAMAFVHFQYSQRVHDDPSKNRPLTRFFEEMDVTERYMGR